MNESLIARGPFKALQDYHGTTVFDGEGFTVARVANDFATPFDAVTTAAKLAEALNVLYHMRKAMK